MRLNLYIDKKFTASGIRVLVNVLADNPGYQNIFRCRIDKILRLVKTTTIPVYLPGGFRTSFSGPTKGIFVQSRENFESTVTPNVSIGVGSTEKHGAPNVLYLEDSFLTEDFIHGTVKFPKYIYEYPLIADIEAPVSLETLTPYREILENGIEIIDILDENKAVLKYSFPCNVDSPISCEIECQDITYDTKGLIQTMYGSSGTMATPNPYSLVLRNGFVEEFNEATSALAFIGGIKADVRKYVDDLKRVGSIDGIEVYTYEV